MPDGSKELSAAVKGKDLWDKIEVLSRPLGAVTAAVVVAIIGAYSTNYFENKQLIEANTQLYAEIMSRREQAESTLRKDMFKTIIETFVGDPNNAASPVDKVLNMELLANNFHESLDLSPLFKHVHQELRGRSQALRAELQRAHGKSEEAARLTREQEELGELLERLENVAKEVVGQQVAALRDSGASLGGFVDFEELSEAPGGIQVINDEVDAGRIISVRVLHAFEEERALRIQLSVKSRRGEDWDRVDTVFKVGYFDFPMIDNTRLSDGMRCSVVLEQFSRSSASIRLVYFAGLRASLKEKPFYEEIFHNLLTQRRMIEAGPPSPAAAGGRPQ